MIWKTRGVGCHIAKTSLDIGVHNFHNNAEFARGLSHHEKLQVCKMTV